MLRTDRFTKKLINGMLILSLGIFSIPTIGWTVNESSRLPLMDLEKSFISVVKKVKPAVVDISAEKTITRQANPFTDPFGNDDPMFRDFFRRFFQQPPQREKLSTRGSGVIVRKDGYILTNDHVVANVDKVTVTLSDGRTKDAKIIGTDKNTDLAVIKIEGDNYTAVELGDSDNLEVGQIVFAFGSPFAFTGSVSQGIISGLGRDLHLSAYENLIQTDAAMNPGNSGGPLVNLHGEVIGINKAIATQGAQQSAGIGFAIPVNLARTVMGDLIKGGKWVRGYLGIFMDDINEEKAKQLEIPVTKGVLVSKVIEKSPAEKAGLKEYDVILEYNGKPVETSRDLTNMVALTKVGEKVNLKIIREGKEKIVSVSITERTEEVELAGKDSVYEKWGLKFQVLTQEMAKNNNIEYGDGGIVIVDVSQDSPAFELGVRKGDILLELDKKSVKDLKELSALLSAKKSGDKVLFRIRSGEGGYRIISFSVPDEKAKK